MNSEPVIPTGSRAVLIGVPDYQDVKYLSYPAVGNSVDGMYELLVESGFCGWRKEQVSKIVNPANACAAPAPAATAGGGDHGCAAAVLRRPWHPV